MNKHLCKFCGKETVFVPLGSFDYPDEDFEWVCSCDAYKNSLDEFTKKMIKQELNNHWE